MNDSYDVFVSYSKDDLGWVEGVLLPKLESASVTCCFDKRDFELGVSPVKNMALAVIRSKCTLLVVSQAWAKSQFTGFEGLFSKLVDSLVIPILLNDFDIPPWILSAQSCADLRNAEKGPAVLETLTRQLSRLKRPDATAVPIQSPDAGRGATQVKDFGLGLMLRTVCDRIDRVGDLKDVHNEFHVIQYDCHVGVARNLDRKEIDEGGWEELDDCANALNDSVVELHKILPRLPERQRLWFASLLTACAVLNSSVRGREIVGLKEFRRQMNTLLAKDWVKMVICLNEAASNLLPELKTLGTARNSTDLLDTSRELETLVDRHDRLQQLDSLLRASDAAQPVEFWWPDIDEWGKRSVGVSSAVDGAIATLRPSIAHKAQAAQIRRDLRDLESKAGKAFQRADSDLKRLCDQLRRVDGPYAFLREAS